MIEEKDKMIDEIFAACCREWLKGCICASKGDPSECEDCTKAFLNAIRNKAQAAGVKIGENAIGK